MTTNELPLTKNAILDAAETVLRRYGPDKTSVVDIAKALQVSHGTLYRHFASKTALREAVTERWLQSSISIPLAKIAEQTEGSAAAQLRLWIETLIRAKWKFALEDAEMFGMYAAVTVSAVEIIAVHVEQLIAQLAFIIERGMASGEFKPGQPLALAKAVFVATSRFHHPSHAYEWTGEAVEAEFESVWQLLLLGLV
ncbi:TetR family transcriptional regulator [Paenibacillus sp. R14(2021)]|uniref:TetR family transcriptional regulator n=1 Tax=Paenibacillus sp. R14(2021) TaxID=2859228 RepID=UPI001C6145F9|nr:TetR family transcriptional regulator [Paenibacillus sp. R14(2021)]